MFLVVACGAEVSNPININYVIDVLKGFVLEFKLGIIIVIILILIFK